MVWGGGGVQRKVDTEEVGGCDFIGYGRKRSNARDYIHLVTPGGAQKDVGGFEKEVRPGGIQLLMVDLQTRSRRRWMKKKNN